MSRSSALSFLALAAMLLASVGCDDERRSVQLPSPLRNETPEESEPEHPHARLHELGETCSCEWAPAIPNGEGAGLPLSDVPSGDCRCAQNTAGLMALVLWDRDGDDLFDGRYDYLYDPAERIVNVSFSRDPVGALNWRFTFDYDSDGNVTEMTHDSDGNGRPNRGRRQHFDSRGNLVLVETDRDGDGHADRRREQSFDDRGRLTLVETDTNVDGRPERRRWMYYDDADREVRVEQDNDGDAVVDDEYQYGYDAQGNRVTVDMRRGGVSQPTQRCRPACPPPYENCRCGD